MRQPHAPVAEIRECYDGLASHAEHFTQHFKRCARFLKGLAEDYIVERLIGEIGECVLDVAMKNRNAAPYGLPHLSALNLHPTSIHVLILGEPGQQLALPAAEVQHARIGLDDFADDGVVAPSEQLWNERFGHP